MKSCEACGNNYEHMIEIKLEGDEEGHWFDCFQCAIHKLAPNCKHCQIKIVR